MNRFTASKRTTACALALKLHEKHCNDLVYKFCPFFFFLIVQGGDGSNRSVEERDCHTEIVNCHTVSDALVSVEVVVPGGVVPSNRNLFCS